LEHNVSDSPVAGSHRKIAYRARPARLFALIFAAQSQHTFALTAILYYLILWPLSRLPMGMLYGLGNLLFVVLYRVAGFRKKVVRTNLMNSFPEKSKSAIDAIEKEYYHHLSDLIVESIKFFSIGHDEAQQRMKYTGTEIFQELYRKGKSVVIVGGHYGSWELLAVTIAEHIPHRMFALYTPLANRFLNEKMQASRSKYGLNMVPVSDARPLFKETKNYPIAAIFGSDQSPRNPKKAYWLKFLNQDTGVQFGAEKFAKEYDCAVVYGQIKRLGRGNYETEFRLLCEDPGSMKYGEITESHTKMLEEAIIREPAYWLWSHRRWKRKRPAEVNEQAG
jgi:KDO2-lipid IV(A) lauroyltransferase